MLEQALDIPLRDFGAACVRRALASGVVQADFLHVGSDHAGNARVGVLFPGLRRTKVGHMVVVARCLSNRFSRSPARSMSTNLSVMYL
jgi:hypothetical protein